MSKRTCAFTSPLTKYAGLMQGIRMMYAPVQKLEAGSGSGRRRTSRPSSGACTTMDMHRCFELGAHMAGSSQSGADVAQKKVTPQIGLGIFAVPVLQRCGHQILCCGIGASVQQRPCWASALRKWHLFYGAPSCNAVMCCGAGASVQQQPVLLGQRRGSTVQELQESGDEAAEGLAAMVTDCSRMLQVYFKYQ